MTSNQIRYQEHVENVRHNQATESETNRHNVQDETIRADANRINEEHYVRADQAALINANAAQTHANAAYLSALAAHQSNAVKHEANMIQQDWNTDYGNILRFNAVNNAADLSADNYQNMLNTGINQQNADTNARNAETNQQNANTNERNADTNRYNFYNNVIQGATGNLLKWADNPLIQQGLTYLLGGK